MKNRIIFVITIKNGVTMKAKAIQERKKKISADDKQTHEPPYIIITDLTGLKNASTAVQDYIKNEPFGYFIKTKTDIFYISLFKRSILCNLYINSFVPIGDVVAFVLANFQGIDSIIDFKENTIIKVEEKAVIKSNFVSYAINYKNR